LAKGILSILPENQSQRILEVGKQSSGINLLGLWRFRLEFRLVEMNSAQDSRVDPCPGICGRSQPSQSHTKRL